MARVARAIGVRGPSVNNSSSDRVPVFDVDQGAAKYSPASYHLERTCGSFSLNIGGGRCGGSSSFVGRANRAPLNPIVGCDTHVD